MLRPQRSAGLFLAVLPLALGVGGLFGARALLTWRAEASILEHQAEVKAIEACRVYQASPPGQPHPWGNDNAWDLLHPALDELLKLGTVWADESRLYLSEDKPAFKVDEVPLDTMQALQDAEPHFDACRRALGRSDHSWHGAPDDGLPGKTLLACQHLVSRGFIAWQQGRDEVAVDSLLVALGVANETVQLRQESSDYFQPGLVSVLRCVNLWATELLRLVLSKHALRPAQLEDVERRLDRELSRQPRVIAGTVSWGGMLRQDVMNGGSTWTVLQENVGPRDLYSEAIRTARLLDQIRDLARERPSWKSSADLDSEFNALCLRYRRNGVGEQWRQAGCFWGELAASLRRDLLRVATGVARFEATAGRMPATLEEAGVGGILAKPTAIRGNRLLVTMGQERSRYGDTLADIDPEWVIGHRSGK